MRRGVVAAAALVCGAAGVRGQSAPVELAAPELEITRDELFGRALNEEDWTLRLEPAVWLVSPSGQLELPGASDEKVRIEDLNLDTPKARPSGEIHLSADRWRFSFFGSQYAADPEFVAEQSFTVGDVAITPGDTVDVSFDFTVVEVAAGYCIWSRDYDEKSENPLRAVDTDLRVFALGGLQLYDLDLSVAEPAAGTRSATNQTFVEPIVGVRTEAEIARDFSLDLQVTAGGYFDSDRSSASLDLVVGFHWRPHPNVGVHVGWRQLAYWLTDGEGPSEFEYNGRMAGIQGGLVLRF